MNKKEFIESEKDCASLMGISLSEYEEELKIIKRPKFKKIFSKKNNILKQLGITSKDLKKKSRLYE